MKINWKVAVPLITLATGILGTVLTAEITGNLNTDAQIKSKAADIIFAGDPTGTERSGRVSLLAQLYPQQLGAFATAGSDAQGRFLWPSADEKRLAFYQQAMSKVECVDQIVDLWRQLFGPNRVFDSGKTEWIETLKVAPCPPGTKVEPLGSAAP